jgi:hypothetical protein
MAIVVAEKWDSRELNDGDQATVDLKFVVRGTTDDLAARDALLTEAPELYGGLVRQSAHMERIAWDTWEASIRYGERERKEPGESSFAFDTGGGNQHITQSLATVGAYAAPGQMAPNFRGAIGVTHDSVEGVDVTIPVYNFSETHYLATEAVTGAYKAALFHLTGRVNNAPFKGFAAGEVLFLGASGSKRGKDDWEITFKFAASPNASGLVVGEITGITKKGWEYLWVRYADAEDTDAHVLVKKPVAAYVEQVYPYGNFAGLGIGV